MNPVRIIASSVLVAVVCGILWIQSHHQAHQTSYEVKVRIGQTDFSSFTSMILASQDLLQHLPYSFHGTCCDQKTSGAPQISWNQTHKSHIHGLMNVHHIPTDKHLYLQRDSVAEESLYSWLKQMTDYHQNPPQIDLILIKNRSTEKRRFSSQVGVISLYSSTPIMWSVESEGQATDHFDEYAHISYQSLSQRLLESSPHHP